MIGKMKVAVVVFGSLLFEGFAFGQRVVVYSPVFETVVPETVVVERPLLPVTPPPIVVSQKVYAAGQPIRNTIFAATDHLATDSNDFFLARG